MPKVRNANASTKVVPDHLLSSETFTSEDSIGDVRVHSAKRQTLFKRTSIFKPEFPDELFINTGEDIREQPAKRQKLFKHPSTFKSGFPDELFSDNVEDDNDSVGVIKNANKRSELFRRVSTFQPEFPTLLFEKESDDSATKDVANFCTSTPFGKTGHAAGYHEAFKMSPIPLPQSQEKNYSDSEMDKTGDDRSSGIDRR